MKERLSASTVCGNAIQLALGLLAAIVWILLTISDFHRGESQRWLILGIWLFIIALNIYRTSFYQVVLTSSNLVCTRLFARPLYYRLTDFVALTQTERVPDRPLRICFKDGQSFLFSPKLKDSSFSFYAISKVDFIAYWTEEIEHHLAATVQC